MYKKPSEEVFNEIKEACLVKYSEFDNTYGYVDKKFRFINEIKNEGADVMFIMHSLHPILRATILPTLSKEAKEYIMYFNQLNSVTSKDEDC